LEPHARRCRYIHVESPTRPRLHVATPPPCCSPPRAPLLASTHTSLTLTLTRTPIRTPTPTLTRTPTLTLTPTSRPQANVVELVEEFRVAEKEKLCVVLASP
jgi:hypothetical protein